MEINIKRFSLIILIIVFSACNNDKKNSLVSFVLDPKENYYKLDIPNPIIVNQDYVGTLIYNSSLDKLNLELGENRYATFFTSKNIDNQFSNLDTLELKEIMSIDDNKIYLEFNFASVGDNFLRGYIEEKAFITKSKDSTRIITNRIYVNAVIPVIENTNSLGMVSSISD